MVSIHITYQGELHCEAAHGPSGTLLATDAPKDNHGRGESFSPTDLLAAALGSCVLTVMGIAARSLQVDITGATVQVEKVMAAAPVRRVASLHTQVTIPAKLSPEVQQKLEQAARNCPVHHSLHPDIDRPMTFHWA